MWPLIKAELTYHQLFLVTALVAMLGILTFLWYSPVLFFIPEIPFDQRIGISFCFLFYVAFVIPVNTVFPPYGVDWREKRNRLLALLPFSPQQLGSLRAILLILVWAGLAALFLLFLLITGSWAIFWEDPIWLQVLVSLSGAVLTGAAYVALMIDLQTLFPKGKKFLRLPWQQLFNGFIVFSTLLYFLTVCYAILQCNPGVRFSLQILVPLVVFLVQSWTGATVLLLTGVTLTLVSIRTFELRKSYLE